MQLSEASLWQVSKLLFDEFKQDQLQRKLDTEHLSDFKKTHVKPLYPHKTTPHGGFDKYSFTEACCVVDPGAFFCCRSTVPDSSFRKLGLGLCLYFKFIKHASMALLGVSVLAVLACSLCVVVGVGNGFDPALSYSSFFFATSLGTFSSEHFKCEYAAISGVGQASWDLSCSHGRVGQLGSVLSNQTKTSLLNCRNEIEKYQSGNPAFTTAPYLATDSSTCSPDGHQCHLALTFTPNIPAFPAVAYAYECLDNEYGVGGAALGSERLLVGVVGLDLVGCLILGLFYLSEKKAQEQEIRHFKGQQLTLSDFSLQIKGFRLSTFSAELDGLIRELTRLLGPQLPSHLVQVKAPDHENFLVYQAGKDKAYRKLYGLMEEHFFEQSGSPHDYSSPSHFRNNWFIDDHHYQQFKTQLERALLDFAAVQYDARQELEDTTVVSAYFVLDSIKIKKLLYDSQHNGCFSRYFRLGGRQYVASEPPQPDLVLWGNKGKWRGVRVVVSWAGTLAVCLASYLLFGFIQSKQNELLSSYNYNVNCALLFPNDPFLAYDSSLSSPDYLTCFCQANLLQFDYPQCSQWKVEYAVYVAIPTLISLLLVVYNVAVSAVFRKLSEWECHWLVGAQLTSYTLKRSFLLVMNMGLIMILLNLRYPPASPDAHALAFLFSGQYSDLTADWFVSIAPIIVLTMIFNIAFPLIELLLATLTKALRRCWDRKLGCRKTSCKTKAEYVGLYSDDVYPIQERYAFLISVLLITLAFSCIMPLLNLIATASLLLLYFADKALIFRVYQTPINYNEQLHALILKVLYVALMLHMGLSALFLSQPSLVAAHSSLTPASAIETGSGRLNTIVNHYYMLAYVGLLLLMGGWVVVSAVLSGCEKCSNLCKKSLSNLTKYKLQQTFYQILTPYQIRKLKLLTQAEITKLTYKQYSTKQDAEMQSLNHTARPLQHPRMTEHEALLRRTYIRLRQEESIPRRDNDPEGSFLIGMPAYEMLMNDDAFEQNKKNMMLSDALRNCLKEELAALNDPT